MKTLISHIILMLHCVFIAEISAVLPAAPTGKTWELVPSMSDEFNYTGMPSSSGKWTDNNPNGWSGRWPGLFMDSQVWVNGTDLTITAEPHNDTGWTIKTGYIATHTKIKYPVYFECSMKASDLSMASSFWMKLGDQGNYSEIDVTETYGHPTATSSWYQNDVPYFMRCNTHYHDQNEGANYSNKNLITSQKL